MPMNNGEIQTATYVLASKLIECQLIYSSINVGKNALGATFKESHPNFDNAILRPYGDFLRTAYCKSISHVFKYITLMTIQLRMFVPAAALTMSPPVPHSLHPA